MLKPFQQRVVEESNELTDKINKLADFINGSVYMSLPEDEQVLLFRQYKAMREYQCILSERIMKFQMDGVLR